MSLDIWCVCLYKRYRRGVRDSRSQCVVVVSFAVSLRIRTTVLLCCTFTPAAWFLLETPSIHHSFNSRCWNILLKCKSYPGGGNTLNHSFPFQLFCEFIFLIGCWVFEKAHPGCRTKGFLLLLLLLLFGGNGKRQAWGSVLRKHDRN